MDIHSDLRKCTKRAKCLIAFAVLVLLLTQPVYAQHDSKEALSSPDYGQQSNSTEQSAGSVNIPDQHKFQECWKAAFTESESYTQLKNQNRYILGMVVSDRRNVIKTPITASYIFCFEKDGRGALVVNGALVPMVRPKDSILYGDNGDVTLFNPPVALYAEWVRPNQPDTELLITLDKETKKVTATKRAADGKTRYKASSMMGTATKVLP